MSTTRSYSPFAALLGTSLLGAIGLAGCSRAPPGPAGSETRTLEAFHAIELRGAGDAQISVGKAQAVTITSENAALPGIVTRVANGVLIVENVKDSWFRRQPTLKLRVELPALDSFNLNGTGNVSIENAAGPRLELAVSGAGNLSANGEVGALDVSLNGAGNMELVGLHAGDARATVNGAGNVSVYVTGQLEATVNGVGSITYAGNPREAVPHVNGVGSISPAGSPEP